MNQRFSFKFKSLAFFSLLVSLVLAGCASGAGSKKPETLADRAVARWNYLINKDPGSAWAYLTPGARSVTPEHIYISETLVKPVQWTGVEYVSQTCDAPDTCSVRLNITFKIRSHLTGVGMIGSSKLLDETWLRTGDNWYYLPPKT